MLQQLFRLDQTLTNLINSFLPHNSFFDIFFAFFSQKGSSVLIWIAIAIALIVFEEIKDRRFIIFFALSFLAAVVLSNFVLKNIFQRPRPHVSATCQKDFSFPSGHATTAFAAAATLSTFDKKRRYFYYLVAALIGLSRIYLQCHYFFDVLFGGLFGYGIGRLILSSNFFLRASSRSKG